MPPHSPSLTQGVGTCWNGYGAPLRTSGAEETASTVVPCELVLVSVYDTAILPAFSQLPPMEGAARHNLRQWTYVDASVFSDNDTPFVWPRNLFDFA